MSGLPQFPSRRWFFSGTGFSLWILNFVWIWKKATACATEGAIEVSQR
jgi:hypothetical protein